MPPKAVDAGASKPNQTNASRTDPGPGELGDQFVPLTLQRTLAGAHSGPCNVARFNRDGNYLLTGGSDKMVKLWNPNTGLCIKTYAGHGWEVLGLAVSADNSRFASGGGDKSAFLWDVATARTIRRFTGHTGRINDLDFNSDASLLASASYDATVRLWDVRAQSKLPIQILDQAKDSVSSVRIRGASILTGSVDGHARCYDVRAGAIKDDEVGHSLATATFSNDGNCILASSLDDTVRLFDAENGELLASYSGHRARNYRINATLTGDDARVLAGSEDGRVFIWDLVDGKALQTLQHGTGTVLAVECHPKAGKTECVSAGADGSVKIWA